jgi:hypothetical protein
MPCEAVDYDRNDAQSAGPAIDPASAAWLMSGAVLGGVRRSC